MKVSVETVKKQDGNEWQFNMPLTESLDEMREVYGEDGAFKIASSQEKISKQNLAREKFHGGATREEVEEAVEKWKPGGGSKKSLRAQATDLVMSKSYLLQNEPELYAKVQEDFVAGKFKAVIEALEDLE